MSATPPREIIKWLQTLDLTFPIKNYKRDFSNGYLFAEILSKYYPLDVQMHSFDTGTGAGAKKNNWNLLERIFVKYSIPITKELLDQVAASQPKSTTIVLTIIYGYLSKKGVSSENAVIVTSLNSTTSPSKIIPQKDPSSDEKQSLQHQNPSQTILEKLENNQICKVSGMSINQAHLNYQKPSGYISDDIQGSYFGLVRDDQSSSNFHCTKILFSIFVPLSPQVSFYRSIYQPSIAREVLTSAFEKKQELFEIDHINDQLKEKSSSLKEYLQLNNTSDFTAICETFLPILTVNPVSSLLFKSVIHTLCFYGDLCQQTWGGCKAYRKLESFRDFTSVIRLVSLKSLDKIPFIASLIQAFLGTGTADAQCVRIFLDLKNMINEMTLYSNSIPGQPQNSSNSSCSEYMLFFAAFNAIEFHQIHSASNQLTVFHLSECLNIINSYKSSIKRRSLLVASEEEKNTSSLVISTADVPCLEVSAMLHILASILRCKISLQLKILSDVICSALRIFFKIVVHPFCPSNIKKAYIQILLLLNGTEEAKSLGIQPDIFSALVLIMKKLKGETLKDVLYMIAPTLHTNHKLSTCFVSALLSVPTLDRIKMIHSTNSPNLSWDLPFMFEPECQPLVTLWDPFVVVMGILRMAEIEKGPLTLNALELMQMCIQSDIRNIFTASCIDKLFGKVEEYLYSGLGIEECSQAAWDVFLIFIKKGTPSIILKNFHVLLAVLLYAQTLESTKCKRRLMGRLRKLATLDVESLDPKDRYFILRDMDADKLILYKKEAERILKLFRLEFPALSKQKSKNMVASHSSVVPSSDIIMV